MTGSLANGQIAIGLDVGTTAVKAAAYSSDGRRLAYHRASIQVLRSSPGLSEQNMETVWQTVLTCLRGVIEQIDGRAVASIGVCGQGDGLWMLDANKMPLRNAILWNDRRADALVSGWMEDGTSDKLSRFSRTANWSGTAGSTLRWLADNQPDVVDAAHHILFCKDWITYRLSGVIGSDYSDASIPFLDLSLQSYAGEAFSLLGLPDLSNKFSPPMRASEKAGTLLPDIADHLGLPGDVSVATGALDLASMMVGLGLNQPGDMVFILGTTAVFSYIMPPEPFDGPPVGATAHHPFTDDWIRILAPQSGASAFDWFAALHPKSFGGESAAEIAAKINDAAKDVPPGANGVLFLPFLTGERAPFVAPHASASFLGMTATTTKADLARAVMEGASFSLLHCFKSGSVPAPKQVILTGGGARNPLWCQIVADVLGIEIVANEAEDHGLWGAALLGGAAAGLMDALAGGERAEERTIFTPDATAHAIYSGLFEAYLAAIDASQAIWAATRNNRSGSRR